MVYVKRGTIKLLHVKMVIRLEKEGLKIGHSNLLLYPFRPTIAYPLIVLTLGS
jgi:hypothetical protein